MSVPNMEIKITRGAKEATHFHAELELYFVIDGTAEICVASQCYVLEKEDMLLINSSISHSVLAGQDTIICCISYASQLISELMGSDRYRFICNSVNDCSRPYNELRKLLRDTVFQYVQQRRQTECLKISSLYKVLDCLIENYRADYEANTGQLLSNDDKMQQIFQYINQNFQYSISMADLADEMFMSTSTLSRFFKKQTGIYFTDYVTHIRMRHAVQDLLKTDKGITKIAVDCGFSNPSVFNRSFREIYGMTPTDYRLKKREAELEQEKQKKKLMEELRQELQERLVDQTIPFANKATVIADVNKAVPYEKKWKSALNVGSFDSLTQAMTQQQILFLHDQLGFRYARVWSIFSKKMTLTNGQSGGRQNYSRIDSVLDFLVNNHMLPFLDFANRPDVAIGALDEAVFRQLDYIDFENRTAWEECFRQFVYHIIDRYGEEEVSQWRFEFSYNRQFIPESNYYPGDDFDFFQMFQFAWHTIKEELPEAEVGGPMGIVSFDEQFVIDFLKKCHGAGCIPDFVSFMLFPYRSSCHNGQPRNELVASEQVEMEYVHQMHEILLHSGCINSKLYITEWNNTVSNRNYLNDSCFRGTYFVRKLPELSDAVDLVCIWMATDLISSYYDSDRIACGGGGLLTKDGIPKPAFYAIQFMNALGTRMVGRGPNYIITSKESGSYYILCSNCKWYSCNYFLKRERLDKPGDVEHIFEDSDPVEIVITLEKMPQNKNYVIKKRYVAPQEGSLLAEWKKFQYDAGLLPSNLRYIKDACFPRMSMERQATIGGQLKLDLILRPHEIALIHIHEEVRHRTFREK